MKLKRILTAIILSIAAIVPVLASSSLTPHRGTVKDGYNFWLYNPDVADVEDAKPVIIFLHGASLCGNDLNKVKRYGTIDAIEKGRDIDAYVIAPQNPGGAWSPRKVMNVLDWVSDNYNIDYDRVYVIGMSLGGYGTIDVAATYPDRIAAAIAMCGGSSVNDLSGLNDVPLWIIHGTADRAVTVSQSDKVVSAMREAAGESGTERLVYNRVPGMNHSKPARMFYLDESYDWLFGHTLKDHTRKIQPTFAIESAMGRAYNGVKATKSKKRSSVTSRRSASKKATASKSKSKSKKSTRRRRG